MDVLPDVATGLLPPVRNRGVFTPTFPPDGIVRRLSSDCRLTRRGCLTILPAASTFLCYMHKYRDIKGLLFLFLRRQGVLKTWLGPPSR